MNNKLHFSSESTEWGTPQWLYDELNSMYRFGLDACATKANAKHSNYLSLEKGEDALKIDWAERSEGKPVWLNPPYGRKITELWLAKAHEESKKVIVVCLVPARTDTKWWHQYAMKDLYCFNSAYLNKCKSGHNSINNLIFFIHGRLKFVGAKDSAPFPSAIIVMGT